MPPDGFFGIQIFVKINFGRGSVPDPAGGAYLTMLPQLAGEGEGGYPLPISHPLDAKALKLGSRCPRYAQGTERAMMVNAYLDHPSCQKLAPRLLGLVAYQGGTPAEDGHPSCTNPALNLE